MITPPVQDISVYTDFSAFDKLRKEIPGNRDDALKKVAQQFEAIFLQMLLKSARNSKIEGGIFDNSQMEFYEDIRDKQMANVLAKKGGLGLAEVIVSQLSTQEKGTVKHPSYEVGVFNNAQRATSDNSIVSDNDIKSKQDFLDRLGSIAKSVGQKAGFSSDILLAQAALETGWGQNIIRYPGGANSFNLFGIKADTRWPGHVVFATTREYIDGNYLNKYEKFRSYSSFQESMEDYVNFIKSNPRYEEALKYLDDPKKYFQEIQKAGYATDPLYSQKLGKLLDSGLIAHNESMFKNLDAEPLT